MTEEYLSQRAFAALPQVGVSHVRVNKLVKEGRIPVNEDGKIPREAGIEAWKTCRVIGFENAAKAGAKYGGNPHGKTKKAQRVDDDDDEPGVISRDDRERLNRAKAEKEELAVKKLKHELAVINGEYIHVDDVRHEAQQLAASIRQQLISIAPLIGATAEGKSAAQIQRIVEVELNKVLTALSKMRVN